MRDFFDYLKYLWESFLCGLLGLIFILIVLCIMLDKVIDDKITSASICLFIFIIIIIIDVNSIIEENKKEKREEEEWKKKIEREKIDAWLDEESDAYKRRVAKEKKELEEQIKEAQGYGRFIRNFGSTSYSLYRSKGLYGVKYGSRLIIEYKYKSIKMLDSFLCSVFILETTENKYEIASISGWIITENKYDEIYLSFLDTYRDNVLKAKRNGGFVLVSADSGYELTKIYKSIEVDTSCELIKIQDFDNKFGYLDKNIKIIIPCVYDEIWYDYGKYFKVKSMDNPIKDNDGKMLIDYSIDVEGNRYYG